MLTIKNRIEEELLNYPAFLKRTLQPKNGLDFCSNDYLGLANHPDVIVAAKKTLANGFGSTSSRFIRGEHAGYLKLEKELAEFCGFSRSLLFSSGYAANIGVLSALIKKDDVVFSDRLNHASIIDGLRLSGAHIIIFDHLNIDDLLTKIAQVPKNTCKFLVTESLFSMDGDIAPLDKYAEISRAHDLALIVDESHGAGLYGQKGAGLISHFGVQNQTFLSIFGLGKAFGCLGGVAAAESLIIEYILQKARTLMYSTALPSALLAAIKQSLELIKDGDHLRQKLFSNINLITKLLSLPKKELSSPIIPIIIGDSEQALSIAQKMRDQGFDIRAIRPPTVPKGTSRLRLSIHATEDEESLKNMAEALKEFL